MLGFIRQAYAKAAHLDSSPFDGHADECTVSLDRKITIQELAQTPPMRQLSEDF